MSKGKLACTLPWREIVGEANFSSSQMSKGKLACALPWREIVGEANFSLNQMSKGKLACTLPWREIVGEANFSLNQMSKGEPACTLPWREIVGEANFSSSQTGEGELACALPWQEIVGTANNFMKDFLKVVDFVHYLRAEGYDMVTSDKLAEIRNASEKEYILDYYNNPTKLYRTEVHLNNAEIKEYLQSHNIDLNPYMMDNAVLEAMFFDYLNRVIRFQDGKEQITWEQLLGGRIAS